MAPGRTTVTGRRPLGPRRVRAARGPVRGLAGAVGAVRGDGEPGRAGLRGAHHPVSDERQRDQDGRHPEDQHERRPAVPVRAGAVEQLVEAGRGDRLAVPVGAVVLLDQRAGLGPDDLGDVADVPPGVEVAAGRRVVIGLDAADDQRPDPGLLADLGHAEAGPATGLRQGLADAHATPPVPSGPRASGRRGTPGGHVTIIAATPVSNRATGQYG